MCARQGEARLSTRVKSYDEKSRRVQHLSVASIALLCTASNKLSPTIAGIAVSRNSSDTMEATNWHRTQKSLESKYNFHCDEWV